ncbi:MAG: hypothetical protein JNL98_37300 [Bryobacterales bacterium]|nr:hypothetical protein [Bryobacterales bacterium]
MGYSSVLYFQPWIALAADPDAAIGLTRELEREMRADDPLRRLHPLCIARSTIGDDALFQLNDGSVASVHLTYTPKPPERRGWPERQIFHSLTDWMLREMIPAHIEHCNL